jgi:hypothetical protein
VDFQIRTEPSVPSWLTAAFPAEPGRGLPSDGNVVGGHATIQQVNPHQLDIQQTTDKAILNWKSFSIAGMKRSFYATVGAFDRIKSGDGTDPL